MTAASRCEHATSRRCRCRCGGAHHGAARYDRDIPEAAYLLAGGDPHLPRIPTDTGAQLTLYVAATGLRGNYADPAPLEAHTGVQGALVALWQS